MFRKRTSKTDLQTEYTCSIRFLDDSEPIQLSFKKDTIGQWLLDRVCEKLNLVEKDYFGLRYVDSEKQRHWLDPLKVAYKQLKGVNPMVLCFRVKFYPAEPNKLHEEITRYHLFLQLRRDLHHGRLLCSPTDAVTLAAYIIQSEVGDYDPEDHKPGYISEFKMLPKQNHKTEEQIMEIHKTLIGQVPSEAEANFLAKACTLDTYGVDPHQVKDQSGTSLYLGVTHQGIMTFRGSRKSQHFKWNQIKRLAYEGKMFIVHVNATDDEEANPKKKAAPTGFKCQTTSACKYLWRCAVEQQLFFTLSSSVNAPKVHSGGSLFARGSRFRFSGRCQAEAYAASENISRTEPNFNRSSSLPNFGRKSESKKDPRLSETLKEDRRKYNEEDSFVSTEVSELPWVQVVLPYSWDQGRQSAVDVPAQPPTDTELPQSPTVKAPLAATEAYEVFTEERKQAAPTTSTLPPPLKLNGSIPVAASIEQPAADLDVSRSSYNPNQTMDEDEHEDEEGETSPKPSLEEQLLQLEEEIKRTNVPPGEQNHTEGDRAANATSTSAAAPAKKSGSCCRVFTVALFSLMLLLVILFVVLFFTQLQHPILETMRKELHFLEPARDFVLKQVDAAKKLFKK